jgi:hypothetical protein
MKGIPKVNVEPRGTGGIMNKMKKGTRKFGITIPRDKTGNTPPPEEEKVEEIPVKAIRIFGDTESKFYDFHKLLIGEASIKFGQGQVDMNDEALIY